LTTLDTLLEEIRTGPSGPQIAAFFDFDGTLIDGYSAAALYSHRLRNFEIGAGRFLSRRDVDLCRPRYWGCPPDHRVRSKLDPLSIRSG